MANDQPPFDRYIAPLLSLLAEHPDGITTTEAYAALADRVGLTKEQVEALLPSGKQAVHHNRIGWAHDRLKRADLSHSVKRGVWALTPMGQALADHFDDELPANLVEGLARPRSNSVDLESVLSTLTPPEDNELLVDDETSSESFTAIEAAKIVMADADGPLHYAEITSRMLERDLWKTKGETPAATVGAALTVDIKQNGESSDFRRTKPGYYELNRDGLESPSDAEVVVDVDETDSPDSTKPPETLETLSFTDAAERVLQVFAGREPMHHSEITDRVLDLHLIETESKNPTTTMHASIIQETKRRKERGDTPRFELHGEGMIGLSRWSQTGLTAYIQAHNESVRRRLHNQLHEMDPTEFEQLAGELLLALGFTDVAVTTRHNDGGIDVRGTLVVGDVIRTRMAVQVKRWKSNIRSPTVQQVRGSLGSHEQGLIITTSDFSSGARTEAERSDTVPVGLMDGTQLVKLLVEHGIGVEKDELNLLRLG